MKFFYMEYIHWYLALKKLKLFKRLLHLEALIDIMCVILCWGKISTHLVGEPCGCSFIFQNTAFIFGSLEGSWVFIIPLYIASDV